MLPWCNAAVKCMIYLFILQSIVCVSPIQDKGMCISHTHVYHSHLFSLLLSFVNCFSETPLWLWFHPSIWDHQRRLCDTATMETAEHEERKRDVLIILWSLFEISCTVKSQQGVSLCYRFPISAHSPCWPIRGLDSHFWVQ